MAERLAYVIDDLAGGRGPDVERAIRVALAALEEVRILTARLDGVDPAAQRADVRLLADVEREAIEYAVRVSPSKADAAKALGISPASLYRRLAEYAAQRRKEKALEPFQGVARHGLSAGRRSDGDPGAGRE